MKATCTRTEVYRSTVKATTEVTPWGKVGHEAVMVVTEQYWQNYPGKVSEFISYDVATFDKGRFMGSYVTPNFPEWADYTVAE